MADLAVKKLTLEDGENSYTIDTTNLVEMDEHGYVPVETIPPDDTKADKTDTILNTTLSRGRKSNTTVGVASFAFGTDVEASYDNAHAEGWLTKASSTAAHAEGRETNATGSYSHAEGRNTSATYTVAHAEGYQTQASGYATHAEGGQSSASGGYAHAEGYGTTAASSYSHAEGYSTFVNNAYAHAEGYGTVANGQSSHAEGQGGSFNYQGIAYTSGAKGNCDHTEGFKTVTASGTQQGNHAEGDRTMSTGGASHAEGQFTRAGGPYSHAEGQETLASGSASHAEGYNTQAVSQQAHAEGSYTTANAQYSHAEGHSTFANQTAAHAEGDNTQATNYASHSEGYYSKAFGQYSHAEGQSSEADGHAAHAEGFYTVASGTFSHSEGSYTQATGSYAHAEGATTLASGNYSHAEGSNTVTSAPGAHTEGYYTEASGITSHAEGYYTMSRGQGSHTEGIGDNTSNSNKQKYGSFGKADHAEGYKTIANSGDGNADYAAHAEGQQTTASNKAAHAEGYNTIASGAYAHAEGNSTTSSGNATHAEGSNTRAISSSAHAEGYLTEATDYYAHAEGTCTKANGQAAHAEGYASVASGTYAHAQGYYTIASRPYQTAFGKYNVEELVENVTISLAEAEEWEPYVERKVGDFFKVTDGNDATLYVAHNWVPEVLSPATDYMQYYWHVILDEEDPSQYDSWDRNTLYPQNSIVKMYGMDGKLHAFQNHIAEPPDYVPYTMGSYYHTQPEGSYFAKDPKFMEFAGNGLANTSTFRSNARALDWEGNEYLGGDLYVHCNPDSTGGIKVATINDIANLDLDDLYHICGVGEYDSTTLVPTIQDPSSKKFYLVPNQNGSSPDLFTEWIYKNNAWEIFGSARIEIPVTDVQINGTSILNNGVANIPLAGTSSAGVSKVSTNFGTFMQNDIIGISKATTDNLKGGVQQCKPVVPYNQHESVFYGLAKLAGADMANSSNAVGTYTDAALQAIQKLLGFDGILGDFESSAVASKAYAIGETFIYNGKRYRATDAIAISDVIAPGTNCEPTLIDGHYVRDTDYATADKAGVAKVSSTYGIDIGANQHLGFLRIHPATDSELKNGIAYYTPLTVANQHKSVFYALSKLAGVDLASGSDTVGIYPQNAKTAIQNMLGVPVASDEDAMEIITQYPKTWEVSA